ncbi:MAG: metal-dependent hydrolase [Flavobacteriales bacterium]|nr:metal-dependent hydrolase [Flavobacteriales bacterium]
MQFTFYGHACFAVEVEGKKLLFDPFISPNEKASAINVDEIEADYILISHGHEDHIADVESIAKRTGAKLISNFEIISWYGKKGIENGHPMNHGGSWEFDFGTVKYVNAVHTSSFPDGSYAGNPGGFIITSKEKTFYYAGDTALTMDMKLIGEYEKLDFAVLPIGDNFTMGIKDAVIAADFIQCTKIVGIHYDTFGYIEIDHTKAVNDFKAGGKELMLLEIGETIEL